MLRKLTITTALALALLAASCASRSGTGEGGTPAPTLPECPEPGTTSDPIPKGCPEEPEPEPDPHEPEACSSSPGDKRCPDIQ